MGTSRLPSIQSLLNSPEPPARASLARSVPSEASSPVSSLAASDFQTPASSPRPRKIRRSKRRHGSVEMTMTQPVGPIKYAPFEDLDAYSHRQILHFGVYPFGNIADYCAQVPYSSDKRDVFEKTGRECLRVFKYSFTDPVDGESYDVMWDYLGGFVRISPFFKCRKHKKTGPSKMLSMNPGLRDVTFHMTGGNRTAQGYWLPFNCAKAVCATFCQPIAGALIPIFGRDFPRQCIPQGSPDFGRMVIDPDIIREATHEVTASRHSNLPFSVISQADVTSHPRPNTAESSFGGNSAGRTSFTRIEDYSMYPRRSAMPERDVSTPLPSPEERCLDSAESSPGCSPFLYPSPVDDSPRPYPSLTATLPIPPTTSPLPSIRPLSYPLPTIGDLGPKPRPTSNPDWRDGYLLTRRTCPSEPGTPTGNVYERPLPSRRGTDSEGGVLLARRHENTASMYEFRPTQKVHEHRARRSQDQEMAHILVSMQRP